MSELFSLRPPPKRLVLLLIAAFTLRLLLKLLHFFSRRPSAAQAPASRRSADSVAKLRAEESALAARFSLLKETLLQHIAKDAVRKKEQQSEEATGVLRGVGDEGEFFGSPHRERSNRTALYSLSAEALSTAVAAAGFTVSDLLRPNAEKLFWIHKVVGPLVSGGMGIRFTVQMNLFAGSVANLGDDLQRERLQEILSNGELGCFALTETGAGVLSGLIVGTTATFDEATGGFVIHTPNVASKKWWISQGITATWAVVIARLILPAESNDGRSDFGPHAFLVNLHENALFKSEVEDNPANVSGVLMEDMDPKTDFNDLDNVSMTFYNLRVENNSLLCGVSGVDACSGRYRQHDPKVPFVFETVAQRLLSGRICIPLAALSFVEAYEQNIKRIQRPIQIGRDVSCPLPSMPFLRDTLARSAAIRHVFSVYVGHVMRVFMASPPTFSPALVEKIAVAKILVLDFAIRQIADFKRLVGSYSLMSDSPFGTAPDILYVFQFAEGDSGILKQKIARDLITRLSGSPLTMAGLLLDFSLAALPLRQDAVGQRLRQNYVTSAFELLRAMSGAGKGQARVNRWLDSHELVNRLAVHRCLVVVREAVLTEDPSLVGSAELAAFDAFYKTETML
jgi:acyl-CoA oxidase